MSDLMDFKCPCCGGAIEFNSSSQNMKCPFCDSEFDIETIKSMESAVNTEENINWSTDFNEWSNEEAGGMSVYSCESCGGEVISDSTTSATQCPYCGSNIVMKGQFSGDLRPDYIIPFKIDKNAAKEALKKHLKGKRFLPKTFKDENHIDKIDGAYVPFWLFNCKADADVKYKAEDIRTWSDSDYEYTEVTTYLVNRAGTVDFERIPVDGASKMPDDLMESIEPYRFEDAVDFQTAYLAGYISERYDVDSQQSIGRANERVKESVEETFKNTVTGHDSVYVSSSTVNLEDSSVNYALYPVWLLHTTWQGQKYTFAMNGQTGKFVGDLPLDKSAYFRWLGIIGVILSAVICAGITLLH